MSLHGNPQCAASSFALHLEQMYGLQLDPYRHRQLVAELEDYAGRVDERDSFDEPAESDPAMNDLAESDESYEAIRARNWRSVQDRENGRLSTEAETEEFIHNLADSKMEFEFSQALGEAMESPLGDSSLKGCFVPATMDGGNYREETTDAA